MPLPLIGAGGSVLVGLLSAAFIGRLIFSVLTTLGLTMVAYTGIDAGFDLLVNQINSNMSGIPSDALNLLHMTGLTTVMFWLINALAFRAIIRIAKVSIMRSSKIV